MAIYRFTITGVSVGTMGGHIHGDYTVEQALAWAIEDARSGRRTPYLIADAGEIVYDAAAIARLAAQQDTSHEDA